LPEYLQNEGLASKGVRVFYFHRTFEEYVTAFRDAGFLLKSLSDVHPAKAMNHDSSVLQEYHRFPFFMVLEFVKGTKPPHPSGRQQKRERRLLLPAPGG
jgi:hypothetical protein